MSISKIFHTVLEMLFFWTLVIGFILAFFQMIVEHPIFILGIVGFFSVIIKTKGE